MLPPLRREDAHHFDHGGTPSSIPAATTERRSPAQEKNDPSGRAMPRYWIAETGLISTVRTVKRSTSRGSMSPARGRLGSRLAVRMARRLPHDRRAHRHPGVVPRTAVGHKFPLMLPRVVPKLTAGLCAHPELTGLRLHQPSKGGGISMGLFVWKQLPVPTPDSLERIPRSSFLGCWSWSTRPPTWLA